MIGRNFFSVSFFFVCVKGIISGLGWVGYLLDMGWEWLGRWYGI